MNHIGQIIKDRRRQLRMSKHTIYRATGVRSKTIKRIEETGQGTWYSINRLLNVLGMQVRVSYEQ